MKRITLLRHAKSSWSSLDLPDIERTLNHRGEKDAPDMGHRLSQRNSKPDYIVCSTAARTQQTAQLLLPAWGINPEDVPVKLDKRIYDASLSMLLDAIADTPSSSTHALLIGHNPGLELLCKTLLPHSVKRMPTSAVSVYDIDTADWADLLGKPATLVFHDFPKNT